MRDSSGVDLSIDVTLILLTFNQESYVLESLESMLSQKFDGNLEIIVADDCSEDSTFSLMCARLQNSFDSILCYSNSVNLGLAKNYECAILKARGKYIAYLEGDDFWTDSLKIQKQFDFLESNPAFSLAFHDFIYVNEYGDTVSTNNLNRPNLRRNRSEREMITGCMIHQNSMMFRNVIRTFPSQFFNAKNHDTFLIAYLAKWGAAGYVECSPLCYRIHPNSLWSSLSRRKKHWNGLVTNLYILSVSDFRFFGVIVLKILSKIKSLTLNQ